MTSPTTADWDLLDYLPIDVHHPTRPFRIDDLGLSVVLAVRVNEPARM